MYIRTFFPKEVFQINHKDAIYGYRCDRRAQCMVGTRANPANRHVVDAVMQAYELDRRTYIVKGSRGKHLVVRSPRPSAAVAQACQIHAKHEIAAPGPASGERDVYPVGSDMIGGACVDKDHSPSPRLALMRLSEDAED